MDVVLYMIIILVTIYAVYLSFERNNGFEPVSFLCALFFAPVYILYAWAVPPVQEGYGNLEKYMTGYGILVLIAIIVWITRHQIRCKTYGIISNNNNNTFSIVCKKADYMKWFISGFFVFVTPFFYLLYALFRQYPDGLVKKYTSLDDARKDCGQMTVWYGGSIE